MKSSARWHARNFLIHQDPQNVVDVQIIVVIRDIHDAWNERSNAMGTARKKSWKNCHHLLYIRSRNRDSSSRSLSTASVQTFGAPANVTRIMLMLSLLP